MLWFDNAQNIDLKARIEKAVAYYRRKYHQEPNLCLIHPSTTAKDSSNTGELVPEQVNGMTIRTYQPVLPGHLWIGIEDKN
jgi:hypothetical protein